MASPAESALYDCPDAFDARLAAPGSSADPAPTRPRTPGSLAPMPDPVFSHPRLAAIHDPLDPDRGDLDAYLRLAERLGARRVLDIGCGTGVFALLLADRGIEVVAVDPARASVDVARAKPG